MIKIRHRMGTYISIIAAALSFSLMRSSGAVGTPGDYVLSAFGISPWKGGYNPRYNLYVGRHLTPRIFGFILLISIGYLAYEVVRKNKIGRVEAGLAFAVALVVFTAAVPAIVQSQIGKTDDLNAIRHDPAISRIEYELLNGDLSSFNVNLKLTNFSDVSQTFTVSFRNAYNNDLGTNQIVILDKSGMPALFEIAPNSDEIYTISSSDFLLDGWEYNADHYKAVCIEELTLKSDSGGTHILKNDQYSLSSGGSAQ